MRRSILHCDLNNFYASVECLYNPELKTKPVAVGGSLEDRHGIILAKNEIAKKFGVSTGEALWQARQKCPDLTIVPPHFDRYVEFGSRAREIYTGYTNKVEPFGLDECWLDITKLSDLPITPKEIADEIREEIKDKLGITASVGVSFNKVFAKLGSDLRKPDYTNVINHESFRETIWGLPASDLLYVGRATAAKLKKYGIYTIGDLAQTDMSVLRYLLGKHGYDLWVFANGLDNSEVAEIGSEHLIKSIGNSTTTPRDLCTDNDVKITIYNLSESVAARLREKLLKCRTVQVYFRDYELCSFERQKKVEISLCTSKDIAETAFYLYKTHYTSGKPIRSIGVRACDLVYEDSTQLSFINEHAKIQSRELLEEAVDEIRKRYGQPAIMRALMLTDTKLSKPDIKADNGMINSFRNMHKV